MKLTSRKTEIPHRAEFGTVQKEAVNDEYCCWIGGFELRIQHFVGFMAVAGAPVPA